MTRCSGSGTSGKTNTASDGLSYVTIDGMTFIYTLSDPITKQVRYVGKTTVSLERRLRGHIEKSRNLNNKWHVAQWIRSLTSQGLVPEIDKIREVELQYLNETEVFCIAEYKRLGCDLTNNTEGGDGGVTGQGSLHTIEALRKRHEAAKLSDKGKGWRGKAQPPEVVAARRASMTPEKQAETIRKANATKARRRAVAAAFGEKMYDNPNRYRPDWTDEDKANLSAKSKEHWENKSDEERQAQIDTLRRGAEDFLRRVAAGEVEDPRLGRTPWNKGIDQGPEVGLKSWETKRANGFVSQKEMTQDIADKCGESRAKVERTLKGHSDKVSDMSRATIWQYYIDHIEDYPKLTIVETDEYHSLMKDAA